jgi:signal transduction histidine kinase
VSSKGVVEAVGKRAVLVVLYLLAALAARASMVDGNPMALVWPAGGLVVAWLVTRPSVREWYVDVPLIVLVGVALSLLAGRSAADIGVLTVANLVAVLATVVAARRWTPERVPEGAPPSSSPQAMLAFLAAVVAGSLAGVALGATGFWLQDRDLSPAELVIWFGRNVCGVAAVGVTTLLIIDRHRNGRRATAGPGTWTELAALFAATGALVTFDFVTELPVTFLLPAAAVWAGSRFASLPVALHALTGGAGVLALTYYDEGPFSTLGDTRTSILLAQLFIAMTLTIGLVLAAAREARADMRQELLTFARRAAHDLRNPLSVIESWTAELATTLRTEPAAEQATATMVAGIERATARMRTLVDALLADAAARDRAPAHHVVDLPGLVDEVAAEYGAAGRVRTLGVRTVAGDPVLIRQLVDNVVANAVKYVRPGQLPEITVTAHRTADRVVIRVADNGIGIPAGAHEWIFEPFRRAHEDGYPGTGLGLSTCRRIVERHGGSMRALPREDGPGSVFEFDLPHALASAAI